jgi:hypothetical protein
MLYFRDEASRPVSRSNAAGSCPVFTPSKDVNDGQVAFSKPQSTPRTFVLFWNRPKQCDNSESKFTT